MENINTSDFMLSFEDFGKHWYLELSWWEHEDLQIEEVKVIV